MNAWKRFVDELKASARQFGAGGAAVDSFIFAAERVAAEMEADQPPAPPTGVTADGVTVKPGDKVYHFSHMRERTLECTVKPNAVEVSHQHGWERLESCYSTVALAEAAAGVRPAKVESYGERRAKKLLGDVRGYTSITSGRMAVELDAAYASGQAAERERCANLVARHGRWNIAVEIRDGGKEGA